MAVASTTVNRDFLFRRLHTLAGVIPVGLFLIEHLFTNVTVTMGPSVYNAAVNTIQHIPFLHVVEFVFIFLPLLYHGVFGLYVAYTAGYNNRQFSWFRNQLFVWQRVTGVFTFVFIIYHLWTTRFSGQEPNFTFVHNLVSNNFNFIFILLGVIAATFHFSNGLWSFMVHWGITVGPRAQRISGVVMLALFVILAFVGVDALITFRVTA
ncbi:MAG: succinate dehydrogenase cytochrome b558 subunit [Firmicutes bacterium]|nr:succinate dehydrogenase cytochrome b558 subunit [Bacillota bacterium]